MVIKEPEIRLSTKNKCKILEVNRSSYYKWLHGSVSKKDDESVIERIGEIYDKHKGTYGKQRITLQLRKNGYLINIKRVARLMKKMNLKAVIRKKWSCRKYTKQHVSKNILNREFIAEEPMQKLVCDVTELKMVECTKYYLYSILDLYNNEIIAFNISNHNDNELVKNGLEQLNILNENTIIHSDQGSQFTSYMYAKITKEKQMTISMSRVGNCYDNACKESFFGHFKEEFYIFYNPKTKDELMENIKSFVNYYNNERLQVKLNGSPLEFKQQNSIR